MNDVSTMDVELIDIGFGECIRSVNEEFGTVEWELVNPIIEDSTIKGYGNEN